MYSSVARARPARTSSDELVTPPVTHSQSRFQKKRIKRQRKLTLVSTRILEQHDLPLLKEQPGLLREEQIRSLDNIPKVRLALRVNERRNVGDVDSFRASTTRHKEISLEPQVRAIPEIGTVDNNFTSYERTSK
jgi:hypothetical protein